MDTLVAGLDQCTLTSPTSGLMIERLASVTEVGADEWDAGLADDGLYTSHAWLRALEESQGAEEVLVARANDQLTGFPLWSGESGKDRLFDLSQYFPGVPGPWQERFLWVGARRVVHNTPPTMDGPQRSSTLSELMKAAREVAWERTAAGVIVPFLPVDYALELAAATPNALVMPHDAEAVVAVPPGGLGGLACSKKDREKRRAEQSAFERSGATVEAQRVTEQLLDQIAPLIAQTRAKYGNNQGAGWMRKHLAAVARSGLFQNAVAFVVRRGDAIHAVNLCFVRGRQLYARYFGANYSIDQSGFDYFTAGYYAPIDYAAAHGLHQYFLSTSAPEAKVRRGAVLAPLLAVVLLTDGEPPQEAAVSAHTRAFVQSFRDRFASRPDALSMNWKLLDD